MLKGATIAEPPSLRPGAPLSADPPAGGAASLLRRLSARYSETARTAPRLKGWRAYANSKLCNVLFVQALARRVAADKLVVHAMHPGLVATRFAANNGRMGRMLRRVMDLRSISPAAGADTVTWLAVSEAAGVSTGQYWLKRTNIAPSAAARNVALAEELWTASMALTALNPRALIEAAGLGPT